MPLSDVALTNPRGLVSVLHHKNVVATVMFEPLASVMRFSPFPAAKMQAELKDERAKHNGSYNILMMQHGYAPRVREHQIMATKRLLS